MNAAVAIHRVSGVLVAAALGLGQPTAAQAQTKIACVGEATTHSAHRTYDPEYPQLAGEFLDADFKVGPEKNPLDGGMLYGAGAGYRIGNFGLPTGVSLDVSSTEVASTIHSPQLMMAEAFGPALVILGPYGPHEPYAGVSLADNFAPDLKALAQRIVAFPSKPTVIIAIPIPRWGEDSDTIRRNIRDWTIQVATELKLPTLDLWTEFLGKRAEFQDQNHLALAGRQRLGRLVGVAVQQWKTTGSGVGGGSALGGTAGVSSGGATAVAGAGGVTTSGGVSGQAPSQGGAPSSSGGAPVDPRAGGAATSAGNSSVAGTTNEAPVLGATPVASGSSCTLSSASHRGGATLMAFLACAGLALALRRRSARTRPS